MRVFLTGHNGYLGSVVRAVLLAAGHTVDGCDAGFFAACTLPGALSSSVVPEDLRDVTEETLRGFDAVVHLAALCNDPLGRVNPTLMGQINHEATVRLARLAKAAGVRRFVLSSSSAVYGGVLTDIPVSEDAPIRPVTPYATSKARAEEGLMALADADFCPVVSRSVSVFGVSPRLRTDLVLNSMVGWAVATGQIHVYDDGWTWRPVVHVGDFAAAFLALLTAPAAVVAGQAFNVGSAGETYRVRDLAQVALAAVPEAQIVYANPPIRSDWSYPVDFQKFARAFSGIRWRTAQAGAAELRDAYVAARVTREDVAYWYTRFGRIKQLVDSGCLDAELRWRTLP